MKPLTVINPFSYGFFFVTIALVFLSLPRAAATHDDLHEQILAVTKKIKAAPRNPTLYLKRAELYRLHKEWKNAEKDFDVTEKLMPDLAAVDLGRGKLWFDARQFSKSKIALEKYLSKEPNSFEGIITFARVCAARKDTERAVKFFSQAIELSPKDSAEIYLERAETLVSANKIDAALSGLDEGIKRFGSLVTLQTAAIDLEVKRKNLDIALGRLDKLAASMPRKESFLFRRGEILLQANRPCEARTALIESRAGFDSLPPSRKNVRAVTDQIAQLRKLLAQIPVKNC